MGNKPLGEFLRARRQRLDPVALDLPSGRRRRTPGLRREEVADRAGISSEWYIKLEQGRDVSPSAETIAALARALLLDPVEAQHLRRLAGAPVSTFAREAVPPIIAGIVEGLLEPAYVTGARWDVLAWNPAADALFGFTRMKEAERNILLFMLTDPAARKLFGQDWAPQAQRMVAMFRTAYDTYANAPAFAELVSVLCDRSTEFGRWWTSHDIRLPSAGTKSLHQPDGIKSRYVHASFQSNDDPALRLALYKRQDATD